MIRNFSTFALLLALAQPALGQGTPIAVNDLSAPTSPAFVLLGVAPASVERPDNARSFVLTALNKLTTTDGGFPKDFALQISPYWMKAHPRLSFREYQEPSITQSLVQSFSISVATSPIATATKGADPLGTHLGLGFSLRPWNGRPNPTLDAKVKVLEQAADKQLDLAEKMDTASEADRKKLEAQFDENEKQTSAAARAIADLDARRVGFFLTLSGGQVWDFFDDDVQNAAAKRRGAWATAAYRKLACPKPPAPAAPTRAGAPPPPAPAQCLSMIDIVAVSRFLRDPGSSTMADYGGRLIWSPTKEFNASVEFLRRNAPSTSATESTKNSNRTAGLLEYRITEDLIVYGTFGQDFQKVTGAKPLVSIIGLNIGFGKTPTTTAVSKKTP